MGLKSFFHKIKIAFTRMHEPSIPNTSSAKKYGDFGEDEFVYAIRSELPECKIKKNVIVQTAEGNAEIDCLILYKNKLFAVEVKRWNGEIIEDNNHFIQYKIDRWTKETHIKIHKSPFKQLNRAVYLLRKQIPQNAWVNTVVFFEESDSIKINSDNVWFNIIDDLILHIVKHGKSSWSNNAKDFFEKSIAADYLHSKSSIKKCIICDDSLKFNTAKGILTRKDIQTISIIHHWYYDELKIKTKNGDILFSKNENSSIIIIDNGSKYRYSLSKLNHIQLSN